MALSFFAFLAIAETAVSQPEPSAAARVFGVVSMNELVCPVLYRIALLRSGEAGRAAADSAETALAAPLPAG